MIYLLIFLFFFQGTTKFSIGMYTGIVMVMTSQMIILFAIFVSHAQKETNAQSKSAQNAVAVFAFFLFVIYGLFGSILWTFRDDLQTIGGGKPDSYMLNEISIIHSKGMLTIQHQRTMRTTKRKFKMVNRALKKTTKDLLQTLLSFLRFSNVPISVLLQYSLTLYLHILIILVAGGRS